MYKKLFYIFLFLFTPVMTNIILNSMYRTFGLYEYIVVGAYFAGCLAVFSLLIFSVKKIRNPQ